MFIRNGLYYLINCFRFRPLTRKDWYVWGPIKNIPDGLVIKYIWKVAYLLCGEKKKIGTDLDSGKQVGGGFGEAVTTLKSEKHIHTKKKKTNISNKKALLDK